MPISGGYYYPTVNYEDSNQGNPFRVAVVSSSAGSAGMPSVITFASPQPIYSSQALTATFAGTAQPVTINQAVTSSFAGIAQPVNLSLISTAVWNNSSSFSSGVYQVLLGPVDLSFITNAAISVVNNSSIPLTSGAMEWSPDNVNFELWDTTTFSGLAAGAVKSVQIWGNSRKWFRFRGLSLTGSLGVYIHANNG